MKSKPTTLCYKIDIKLIGDMPDSVFQTAKAMRALWNALVTTGNETAELVKDLSREERKPIYAELEKELYRLAQQTPFSPGMYHWKWATLKKYKDARQAAMSGKRGWPKEHEPPLNKIKIPFTAPTGKNMPLASDYLHDQSRSFYIRRVREDAYADDSYRSRKLLRGSRGHVDVNGDRIAFTLNMDREIPAGALLPKYALLGERRGRLGWSWAIELTLRCPPESVSKRVSSTGCVASLDLGWRKMGDKDYVYNRVIGDYLRVGMLVDSTGAAFEIRLPLDLSSSNDRRFAARLTEQGCEEYQPRWLIDYRQLAVIQQGRDADMEQLKKDLSPLIDTLPTDMQRTDEAWRLTRQTGLKRLYFGKKDDDDEWIPGLKDRCPDLQFARLIEDWLAVDVRYLRDLASVRLHLERKRLHIYREIAAWMAESYDVLIWEGDLDLKGMQGEKGDPILDAAKKYKNWASLYLFRQCVRQVFARRGKEIVASPAAYSSQVCPECLTAIAPGPARLLTCEGGHEQDQDLNAAHLMLLEELGIDREELKTRVVTGNLTSVDRSHFLRYIVPVKW